MPCLARYRHNYYRSVSPCLYLIFALTLCLFTVAPTIQTVLAQDLDEATISGLVLDQNANVVPGANVTARLVETRIVRTTTTDEAGRYRIIEAPPGTYIVRVELAPFNPSELRIPNIIAGQNVQLNITLYPGIAADTVVVTTEAPPIDTTRTIVGGTVTREELESLPFLSREPLEAVFTLGGTTEEPLSTRDLAEDRNTNPLSTPEEAGLFL